MLLFVSNFEAVNLAARRARFGNRRTRLKIEANDYLLIVPSTMKVNVGKAGRLRVKKS